MHRFPKPTLLALGAGLFAVAVPVSLHAADAPTVAPSSGHIETIEPLAPRVWLIRQAEPFQPQPVGNVTVIEQADGLVLVDAGGSPGSGRRIADLVRSVSAKPVKAVIVTHWHGDHYLGLPAIRATWPDARIIAHERTAAHMTGAPMANYPKGAPDAEFDRAMQQQGEGAIAFLRRNLADESLSEAERAGFARTWNAFQTLRGDMGGAFVVPPTDSFADRLVLDDPDVPVEILHLGRANTDGDAIAWLPRQRIVATGDVVVAPVPFGFGSHAGDWIETLARIRALDFAILVPGHGVAQRGPDYLDRLTALLAAVRAQVAPLAVEGLEPAAIRDRIDLAEHKALFTGGDLWLDRWFDQYWVRPLVDAAWREATGREIVQGGG